MPKVLISDKLHPDAVTILEQHGIDVDFKAGLSPEEQKEIIGEYDGLAIRSATKVTDDMIRVADRLRVIGRAGIGVDNVDVEAATEAGIVVMNTPFGNAITTAEHTISMMMALARNIPQASESTKAAKWEKSKFTGVEVYNKTLGLIGCGNIGGIVANRASGLHMKVIAYDPYLTPERAIELGIEKVELADLCARADFISIHTPLNDQTRGLINLDLINTMKEGVRLINCARGGLIVEKDLAAALESGHVAGAALDVFEEEPATQNPLFQYENVICTPHLGASTTEAQVNVALQIAEQMAAFLNHGAVENALNAPSVSAEDAPRLKPYMRLAQDLGRFVGQAAEDAPTEITIEYQGAVAALNTKPLTATALAATLGPMMDSVNMVNAPKVAQSRGIVVKETHQESCENFLTAMRITLKSGDKTLSVLGTLFAAQRETRLVEFDGVPIETALAPHMLLIRNQDKPGLIGQVGTILADHNQNIADFKLGRRNSDGTAIALVSLDEKLSNAILGDIQKIDHVEEAKILTF